MFYFVLNLLAFFFMLKCFLILHSRSDGTVHERFGRLRSPTEEPRRQPRLRPHLRRRRRGTSSDRALRRFHKTLLRAQPVAEGRLDLVRVQGQRRHLFAGEKNV